MKPPNNAIAHTAPAKKPAGCAAKTRRGGKCKHEAGWGTDHLGAGRCKLHGGASPIKSGRYSKVAKRRLGELLAHHAEDKDPLDLEPDLALMRALTEDFVVRYEEWREALLAWHESYRAAAPGDAELKPLKILDLADAVRLLDRIGAMVKRVEDVRANNAISERELRRAVEAMRAVVRLHASPKVAKKVENDWVRIAV